jgi:hypothetical protein
MSHKITSHGPRRKDRVYHDLLGRKDGGFQCYCGKMRNTIRSLHRHIVQQGRAT